MATQSLDLTVTSVPAALRLQQNASPKALLCVVLKHACGQKGERASAERVSCEGLGGTVAGAGGGGLDRAVGGGGQELGLAPMEWAGIPFVRVHLPVCMSPQTSIPEAGRGGPLPRSQGQQKNDQRLKEDEQSAAV